MTFCRKKRHGSCLCVQQSPETGENPEELGSMKWFGYYILAVGGTLKKIGMILLNVRSVYLAS